MSNRPIREKRPVPSALGWYELMVRVPTRYRTEGLPYSAWRDSTGLSVISTVERMADGVLQHHVSVAAASPVGRTRAHAGQVASALRSFGMPPDSVELERDAESPARHFYARIAVQA